MNLLSGKKILLGISGGIAALQNTVNCKTISQIWSRSSCCNDTRLKGFRDTTNFINSY